jgi:hypothetical protein
MTLAIRGGVTSGPEPPEIVPLSPLPDGPKTSLAGDSDSSLTVVAVG